MRPKSWNFFLQIGLTGSMVSGAEKNREIIPLTWKNEARVLHFFFCREASQNPSYLEQRRTEKRCLWLGKKSWKVALNIRGFWPRNEGKNEVRVLEKFSADRPHGIHGFWSRKEPRNHPLDLEKFLESIVSWAEKDRKMMPLRALESIYKNRFRWRRNIVCFDFESGWALAIYL